MKLISEISEDGEYEVLSSLLEECKDESDPACMDNLLVYLEKLNTEDDEFTEILIERLHGCFIDWEQPWYQRSNSLSRTFKEDVAHSDTFRTDRITKEESDLIDKNWKRFIKLYNVPNKPICFARWKHRDHRCKKPNAPPQQARHFVISFIAQGLQRTLPQVYKHFVTKHAYPLKGFYNDIEEKIMNICFRHEPKHAVMYLSTILSRESRGIYKRLEISKGFVHAKSRVKWTLSQASKFVYFLLKHTGKPLKKLRNRHIDREIWLKMQKDMDVPYNYLRYFWLVRLHPQIFIKEDVKLRTLRKKIFKMLKHSEYKVWKDIRWNDVVKQFPKGYTSPFLHGVACRAFRNESKILQKPLKEIVKWALASIKTKRKNMRLKSLKLNKEGQLEIISRVTTQNSENNTNKDSNKNKEE